MDRRPPVSADAKQWKSNQKMMQVDVEVTIHNGRTNSPEPVKICSSGEYEICSSVIIL